MKNFKFIILIILSLQSVATTYCLNKNQKIEKAKSTLEQILLSDEGITINRQTNCMRVSVRSYRKNLINKFMDMKFSLRSSSSMEQSSRQICRFKLKKVLIKEQQSINLNLSKQKTATSIKNIETSESVMDLVVMEGRLGKLGDELNSIYFMCDVKGKAIEVTLSLLRNFSTELSTVLDVTPGQWINIANVKKNLEAKAHRLALDDGLSYKKSEGIEKYNYFLMVEK